MKNLFLLLALLLFTNFVCSQNKNDPGENSADFSTDKKIIKVGGGCEGCEAVHETPIPIEQLSHIDTLPDFNEEGPKIEISGVVFKADGITPVPGVVLYVYHTDQKGYYSTQGNETGWGKRHGYIRGWLKTNEKGEYKFYTLKPAPYPNATFPAHIHPTIKEADKSEYWIDDYVFDDDKFVDDKYRRDAQNRGGDGIVKLSKTGSGLYTARRDIILGKNIEDYPK
jgi:protocatechuate 3,4-dioxygenase, beta subunit